MALLDKVIRKLMRENKKEELAEKIVALEKQNETLEKRIHFHAEREKEARDQLRNSMTVFPTDGVVIRTDGTIAGSDIFINGERPKEMTSVRLWMNIQNGIELSYETLSSGEFDRVWVYGEDPERSAEYQKEKEKRRDRVNKEIKQKADERKVVDWKGKEIPKENIYVHYSDRTERLYEDDNVTDRDSVTLEDRWVCSHCMAGNVKSTARQKKDKIQCSVCRQWSDKK